MLEPATSRPVGLLNQLPLRTFLVIQWLRLCASNARGTGSIPGRGSSACHAVQPKKNQLPLDIIPRANQSIGRVRCHLHTPSAGVLTAFLSLIA